MNKQLFDEAEYDMKNTLRDLHNSSYHTKAEFNNCFIIHSKYFQELKNTKRIEMATHFGVEFSLTVASSSAVAGF